MSLLQPGVSPQLIAATMPNRLGGLAAEVARDRPPPYSFEAFPVRLTHSPVKNGYHFKYARGGLSAHDYQRAHRKSGRPASPPPHRSVHRSGVASGVFDSRHLHHGNYVVHLACMIVEIASQSIFHGISVGICTDRRISVFILLHPITTRQQAST
jgi:hypothetical protein